MLLFGREIQPEDSQQALSVDEVRARGRLGRFVEVGELLPLLRDPVTKQPLELRGDRLVGASASYPITEAGPQLFPCAPSQLARDLSGPDMLTRFPQLSPIEQYCAYGMLKASGNNNNLDHSDVWYGRHLWRAAKLLEGARGDYLDVGCDDAFLSRGMLDASVRYVGLEPSTAVAAAPRVAGLGEFLPFADACFDGIGFQTSLDHVFDYHLALEEAHRVLRPGGSLYLATLVWLHGAQLHTDTVHFHHFRAGQLEAALGAGFKVEQLDCYVWKNNTHRFGIYLRAVKN